MRKERVLISLNQSLLIITRGGRRFEVIRFCGYDMPHPSAWIIDITHVAWDNVKMEVKDGLSGRRSEIETNIKSVGRMARSNGIDCLVDR